MGKTVKIKEKKSKVKKVPQNLKTDKITDITVELSWDNVNKAILYQVSSMKVSDGFFRRNAAAILKVKKDEKGTETRYKAKDLEQDTEYEFHVRGVLEDGVGEWSKKVVIKTKMSAPKNIKLNINTWDSITLSWGVVEK